MKVGDLVRIENDDVFGIIIESNPHAEPSMGPCWYVFYSAYGHTLPAWESEMEVISECG